HTRSKRDWSSDVCSSDLKNKKMVEKITSMEDDFAQWYTDVVKEAELVDYGPVRGTMIIEPYGFALWENIRDELDRQIKATGHSKIGRASCREGRDIAM